MMELRMGMKRHDAIVAIEKKGKQWQIHRIFENERAGGARLFFFFFCSLHVNPTSFRTMVVGPGSGLALLVRDQWGS